MVFFIRNFRAQDMPGAQPVVLPSREVRAAEAETASAGEGVPHGTTAEILAWAGDDPDRLRAALAAEEAAAAPRRGLLARLGDRIADTA